MGLNELENMLGRARSLFEGRQSRTFNYPDDLETLYCKPLLDQNLVTSCKIQDFTKKEELDGGAKFANFVQVVRTTADKKLNVMAMTQKTHMEVKFENLNLQHLPLHGEYNFSAFSYVGLCMILVIFQGWVENSMHSELFKNSSDWAFTFSG